MKKKLRLIVLCLFTIAYSTHNYAQSPNITAKFIGNCGMFLSDGDSHLYVDFPYKSGAFNYMEYDASEIDSIEENAVFLFTHHHNDHYSRKLMRKVKKRKGGKVFGNWNTDELDSLNESFSIEAIKTSHNFSLKHYSYVITWHGKRFYFSGDTETIDEALKIENIDWAFITPWMSNSLVRAQKKLDAKMIALYHLYPTQKLPEEKPDNYIFLIEQGEILDLSAEKEGGN